MNADIGVMETDFGRPVVKIRLTSIFQIFKS